MFLRYGMRALQIALGIACLAVVYAGLAPVLRAGPIADASVPPLQAPGERDASLDRYRVISSRNLFRSSVAAPTAPVTEELKESALRLKLCGTWAAQPADQSVACIDDQGTQKRRAFRVGQEISPGVRLLAVDRRRAVIDNHGAREQLKMEEAAAGGAIAPRNPAAARAAPAGAPARAATPRLSERLRQLRERAPAAESPPAGAPAPSKLEKALNGAQLLPVYGESGSFDGIRVSGIQPGGPFAGLAENTVCFEVNGIKLDSPQALPTGLVMNSDGDACLRCRLPDGQEVTRCL
ncbi:MAG: hypothetical protein FJ108_03370 [Deltaproteobacteria bacterium]|nr:hypothetical protein [Deltaproteobacteria bacterium]